MFIEDGFNVSYTARRDSLKTGRPKSDVSWLEIADILSWHWTESRLAVYREIWGRVATVGKVDYSGNTTIQYDPDINDYCYRGGSVDEVIENVSYCTKMTFNNGLTIILIGLIKFDMIHY